MIGQLKLLKEIDSYNIDSFPHSSLFIGESGCGKHTIIEYLSKKLNLEILDITDTISLDTILNINIETKSYIYLIDLCKIVEKKQNIILKFLEDFPSNAFICLICENRNDVIDTVYNRCVTFKFDEYSKDELSSFISDKENQDLILEVCKTPGQIKNINTKTIQDTLDLCNKIVEKLSVANYYNTLSILGKLNCSDKYDKIDVFVFLNVLEKTILKSYINNNDNKLVRMFDCIESHKRTMISYRVNREYVIENLLTELWLINK